VRAEAFPLSAPRFLQGRSDLTQAAYWVEMRDGLHVSTVPRRMGGSAERVEAAKPRIKSGARMMSGVMGDLGGLLRSEDP
jgi:hypothetical protein